MGLARGPCCCRVLVEVVARVKKDAVLKEAAIRTDIRVTNTVFTVSQDTGAGCTPP